MTPTQLRNSILQYAMEGKLVKQDPNDEPASVLLTKIKDEKEQLIKEKKIKPTQLPEITEDEIPYQIPDSWQWVRLEDVSIIIMGQSPKKGLVTDGIADNDHYEFHQGKSFFGKKYLNQSSKITTVSNKLIFPENIVMSVRAPVGDVNLTKNPIIIGRGLAGIISIKVKIKYLFYFLNTQKENLEKKSTGSTFKAINSKITKNILVPLPPLAEQQRIVAKIEKIFAKLH